MIKIIFKIMIPVGKKDKKFIRSPQL